MITSDMTGPQVARIIIDDMERKWARLQHVTHDIYKKVYRRMPKASYCKPFTWKDKVSQQEYTMLSMSNKGVSTRTFYTKVVGNNGKLYYYSFGVDNTPWLNCYTAHFFKRYAERTHLDCDDLDEVAKKYFFNNSCVLEIYRSKDGYHHVFMGLEGLMLCVNDKNLLKCCTFVSLDMLSPLQWKAFQTAYNELLKGYEMGAKYCNSPNLEEKRQEWSKKSKVSQDVAYDIYKQYYEKEE